MKAEDIEKIAKAAATEAVKEFLKVENKNKRMRVYQNTEKLMKNYNRICKSVEEGIAELSEIETDQCIEGLSNDEILINSILKSKLRSIVMLAHIDKCLKLLENEQYQKNTHEKYLAYAYFYLDSMTYDRIAEVYGYAERTARRWIAEMNTTLSIYLFGSDAIRLD